MRHSRLASFRAAFVSFTASFTAPFTARSHTPFNAPFAALACVALGALGVLAACGTRRAPAAVPNADFLVATADSSYWVTGGPQGLRVLGVPMLLARVDGRFREIFVADDDRSYYDAVLVGQRLWSRDLVRGDSVELFADTLVPRYAKAYAAAHPDDAPLGDDDDAAENPRVTVTADLEVLGVHGPYVSYEYRTDTDISGERKDVDRHTARRGVLDVRTGKDVSVAELFGPDAARSAVRRANGEWQAARDSLLALRGRRSARLQRAVAKFAFDSSSFTLDSRDGQPQVVFGVPGEAAGGSINALELEPCAVAVPPWWSALRDELPLGPDSLLRWRHGGLLLSAALPDDGDVSRLTLRDSSSRSWPVADVTAPVWSVLWLDAGLKADDRKALKRAFNDASMYSDDSRIALTPRRARHRSAVVLASYHPH